MIETQKNWSPDWADRIAGAIQSLGFSSLTELLASMPARPYGEIAGHLGKVVPIQVIAIQFREAKLAGGVREFFPERTSSGMQTKNPWLSGHRVN